MSQVVPSQIVALIDQNFSATKSASTRVGHGNVAVLGAIVRLIDELPQELLTISGEDYSALVCGAESIRHSLAFWRSSNQGEIGNSGVGGRNTLLVIREALAKCPDQAPSPMTSGLVFIADTDFRDSIRLDLSTATSALHNGEWKAATVLAGATAEALLLWAIKNASVPSPDRPKGPPEEWDLSNYIKVASTVGLISSSTKQQLVLAQGFRNLIHPGRAQRLGQVCDKGTALAALAAVERVVHDLSRANAP
jgi:hypothetical protein